MGHEVNLVWSKHHHFYDETEYAYYASMFELNGVYMILADGKVWYIGKTYDQDFRSRVVEQHYKDYVWKYIHRRVTGPISFKVAEVQPLTQDRVTRKLISDVEDLLLSAVMPPCNKRSVYSYNGRSHLKIHNIGHKFPLEEEYWSDDYEE